MGQHHAGQVSRPHAANSPGAHHELLMRFIPAREVTAVRAEVPGLQRQSPEPPGAKRRLPLRAAERPHFSEPTQTSEAPLKQQVLGAEEPLRGGLIVRKP